MNKTKAQMKRVAKRVAFQCLKEGSSALPSGTRVVHEKKPPVSGFSTLREDGDTGAGIPNKPDPNEREFDEGSIHDVSFADDLPKIQMDRERDVIDHSNTKFRINQPSVPDNVRR